MSSSTKPRGDSSSSPTSQAGPAPQLVNKQAYQIFSDIVRNGKYANLVIADFGKTTGQKLDPKTVSLVYTACRNLGNYRKLLTLVSEMAWSRWNKRLRLLMILVMADLFEHSTPDYAVVDSWMKVALTLTDKRTAQIVNAVSRKLAARSYEEWAAQFGDDEITYAMPSWIIEELRESWKHWRPSDKAGFADLLRSQNVPPKVQLVRPGLGFLDPGTASQPGEGFGGLDPAMPPTFVGDPQDDERTRKLETSPLRHPARAASQDPLLKFGTSFELTSGNPADLPEVQSRQVLVQDLGSQLISDAFVDQTLKHGAQSIIDLCSGPGGKATYVFKAISDLLQSGELNNKPTFDFIDLHQHRIDMVEDSISKSSASTKAVTELNSKFRALDATTLANNPDRFDAILLDAPCMNLGSLRRRQDSRWSKTPDDLPDLIATQRQLLETAYQICNPGGFILYSTCSPSLAETTQQITHITAQHPGLTLKTQTQLWTNLDNSDCMFWAILQKLPKKHD